MSKWLLNLRIVNSAKTRYNSILTVLLVSSMIAHFSLVLGSSSKYVVKLEQSYTSKETTNESEASSSYRTLGNNNC